MAKVTTKTLDGVGNDVEVNFARYADEIPLDVIDRMLEAEADIIEPTIVGNAETMLKGAFSTGDTARAVFRKAPHTYTSKYFRAERQVTLTFRGVRRDKYHPNGTRNAEIAFVNEFGGRGIAARAFIQNAIDEKNEEAFDNAEKVFDEWLKKEKMI